MSIDNKILSKLETNDSELTNLDLSAAGLTDADVIDLSKALEKNTCLTQLNLSYNKISLKGLNLLNSLKSLKKLDLSGNAIGDAGAKILAINTTLNVIHLVFNQIGSEGAIALAENTTLGTLGLYGNYLGGLGVAALSQNKTLTTLDFAAWDFLNDANKEGLKLQIEQNRDDADKLFGAYQKQSVDEVTALLNQGIQPFSEYMANRINPEDNGFKLAAANSHIESKKPLSRKLLKPVKTFTEGFPDYPPTPPQLLPVPSAEKSSSSTDISICEDVASNISNAHSDFKDYYKHLKNVINRYAFSHLTRSTSHNAATKSTACSAAGGILKGSGLASIPFVAGALSAVEYGDQQISFKESYTAQTWFEHVEIEPFSSMLAEQLTLQYIKKGSINCDENTYNKLSNFFSLAQESFKNGESISQGHKRAIIDGEKFFAYMLKTKAIKGSLSERVNHLIEQVMPNGLANNLVKDSVAPNTVESPKKDLTEFEKDMFDAVNQSDTEFIQLLLAQHSLESENDKALLLKLNNELLDLNSEAVVLLAIADAFSDIEVKAKKIIDSPNQTIAHSQKMKKSAEVSKTSASKEILSLKASIEKIIEKVICKKYEISLLQEKINHINNRNIKKVIAALNKDTKAAPERYASLRKFFINTHTLLLQPTREPATKRNRHKVVKFIATKCKTFCLMEDF